MNEKKIFKFRRETSPNASADRYFSEKISRVYMIGPKKVKRKSQSDWDLFDNVMNKHTILYYQSDGSIRTASYRSEIVIIIVIIHSFIHLFIIHSKMNQK